ncbi:hypothetical protein B5F53_11860 [Blautia sp. An249]|uniref:hypothetical protein n=1 Tax=Blautia sp. An249 TaxID=1965603 RepID=UPI000B389769|nr:hypothetical protein [Blautia sp. An249]OUO77904.1 hypothetical protein B5F53_11860 [Blautia sp. An249]
MEREILQDLKNYLGSDYDSEQEGSLLFCARRAICSFQNKRNYPECYTDEIKEKDMEKYYACLFDLTLYWCSKQGVEFHQSFSGNGENHSWDSEKEIYSMHNVIPIAVIC